MSAAGNWDQKSANAKSGSATLPNPISSMDTSEELVATVGFGELPSRQGPTRPTNRCVWGDVRTRAWYRMPGCVPAETASSAPSMAARIVRGCRGMDSGSPFAIFDSLEQENRRNPLEIQGLRRFVMFWDVVCDGSKLALTLENAQRFRPQAALGDRGLPQQARGCTFMLCLHGLRRWRRLCKHMRSAYFKQQNASACYRKRCHMGRQGPLQ